MAGRLVSEVSSSLRFIANDAARARMARIAEDARSRDGDPTRLSTADLDTFELAGGVTSPDIRNALDELRYLVTEPTMGKTPLRKTQPQPLSTAQSSVAVREAFAKFAPTYTVHGQTSENVRGAFRMQWGESLTPLHRDIITTLRAGAVNVTPRLTLAALSAVSGRGTAEDIRQTTQALLDAGGLGTNPATPQAIRELQADYLIGTDCKNAVYRAAMALQRRSVPATHAFESSQSVRVRPKSPEALAPGDVIVLAGAPGHIVMVAANDVLSDTTGFAADDPFLAGGDVRRMEVWSSWGGGEGVASHFFFYNETTKQWAMTQDASPHGYELSAELVGNVYDHAILRMGTPL